MTIKNHFIRPLIQHEKNAWIITTNEDEAITLPGIMREVMPDEADLLGAYEETALSLLEAKEANADFLGEHHE